MELSENYSGFVLANGNSSVEKKGSPESIDVLVEWLEQNKSFYLNVAREFQYLKKPLTVLLLFENSPYSTSIAGFLKIFLKIPWHIVYATFNNTAEDILNKLADEKIDSTNVSFIDLATNLSGRKKSENSKIAYIDSPEDLTELDFKITEQLKTIQGEKVVVFDSISDMLVYNEDGKSERFLHAISNKIRGFNATAIFITINSPQHQNLIKILSHFCDKTIKL